MCFESSPIQIALQFRSQVAGASEHAVNRDSVWACLKSVTDARTVLNQALYRIANHVTRTPMF